MTAKNFDKALGKTLSRQQAAGVDAILGACERHAVTDIRHVSHALAEVDHETGGGMQPVKETVYASSKNRNPSDATVIARLEKAWKAGKLGTVKTPYWRDGWFGRGQIQLTHESLYRKIGKRLGVDLAGNRDLALDLRISADAAVVGMKEGLFRGKKLADFDKAGGYDHKGARGIVNGDVNKNGPAVAKLAARYEAALRATGFGKAAKSEPASKPGTADDAPITDKVTVEVVQRRLVDLGYTEVGGIDGKVGSMTMAAVLLFREDNGLPLVPVIDKQMIGALDGAKPRKLAPKREQATPDEVRQKVPEANTSWLTKVGAFFTSIFALIGGLFTGIIQNIGTAREKLAPLTDWMSDVPAWVWFAGVLVVAGGLFLVSRHGEAKSIEAFKSGARR